MRRKLPLPFLLIVACLATMWIAALAPAKMRSVKVAGGLCQTTGGKKIVRIPGFPGEKIDRRIRPDLKKLIKRYDLFIVDGYSNDPVHAANGEHPMGLAADIVPDFAHGGTWGKVTKLAKKAEPKQNQPVAPYSWVGYDGDAGHGRGNHLHLSWSHSALTGPRRFPKTVLSKICPVKRKSSSGSSSGSHHHSGGSSGGSGGVTPGGGGKGNGSGGVSPRLRGGDKQLKIAPAHPETASESIG